ncbi:MAG: hypothetical protein M1831_001681 [Alyxoria varia]|nr:MAG: hypothetical protein M1831_001681 [Alyxoria varia]
MGSDARRKVFESKRESRSIEIEGQVNAKTQWICQDFGCGWWKRMAGIPEVGRCGWGRAKSLVPAGAALGPGPPDISGTAGMPDSFLTSRNGGIFNYRNNAEQTSIECSLRSVQ